MAWLSLAAIGLLLLRRARTPMALD